MKRAFLVIFLGLIMLLLASTGKGQQDPTSIILSFPKEPLSQAELNALKFMVEEEKLAYDVYMTLYNKWKVMIFKNISDAEKTHIAMVKALLEKYGIEYEYTEKIGVFHDKELQKLYDYLVKEGYKSVERALWVGATIEDKDIYDLEKELKVMDNQDIKYVFGKLIEGSENHMRAFDKLLVEYTGKHYVPQYITKERLNEILSASESKGKK